jgi:DNA (cytosine-5)-methyltransferase 1
MRFGSLFSGIGGLDLGLERAGMECAWQVEINEWCRRVLARHWPDVPRWDDAATFPPDAESDLRRAPWDDGRLAPDGQGVDLVCGGFPCQPVSLAGKRRGQDDERWLWPEFARIVRVLRPRYILVENVPGLLARGMGDVLGDLAASGYDTEWDCIPAAAVGAPHLRYRVFIVAYAQRAERWSIAEGRDESDGHDPGREEATGRARADGEARRARTLADAEIDGRRDGRSARSRGNAESTPRPGEVGASNQAWDAHDADGGRHGRTYRSVFAGWPGSEFAGWWTTEPDVGRVAHGVPSRVDRLRGLGNAVVPQVAEWIGRRLMEAS